MAKEKEKKPKNIEVDPAKAMYASMNSKENKPHVYSGEMLRYKISSGSLNADMEMDGGFGPGVQRFCGQNNQGKTPEMILVACNFLEFFTERKEEARAVYFMAEGRLSLENIERSPLPFVQDAREWNQNNILLYRSRTFEVIASEIERCVLENPTGIKYCFILDSFDGLISASDLDKAFDGNGKVAGAPSLSKKLLQRIALPLMESGSMLLCSSQVTAEIKLDQYERSADKGGLFSGGNSLLHWAEFIWEYLPRNTKDFITVDGKSPDFRDRESKPLGHYCRIALRKTTGDNKNTQISIPIKVGQVRKSSIWTEMEIIDILSIQHQLVLKGSWYALEPDLIEKIKKVDPDVKEEYQGERAFRKYLESRPEVTKLLLNYIKTCFIL